MNAQAEITWPKQTQILAFSTVLLVRKRTKKCTMYLAGSHCNTFGWNCLFPMPTNSYSHLKTKQTKKKIYNIIRLKEAVG